MILIDIPVSNTPYYIGFAIGVVVGVFATILILMYRISGDRDEQYKKYPGYTPSKRSTKIPLSHEK